MPMAWGWTGINSSSSGRSKNPLAGFLIELAKVAREEPVALPHAEFFFPVELEKAASLAIA